MIGIVDYGMGNLRSVWNALDSQAIEARVVKTAAEIEAVDRLILPGVGAYSQAMRELSGRELVRPIQASVASGKPMLGICLGMQLLVDHGNEPDPTEGLGLIGGECVLMPAAPPQRLPHVGWNTVALARPHPVFEGLRANADYYFVHSFMVRRLASIDALGRTDYGEPFVSVIARGNVVGVQFHPEKSQTNGLRILENFSSWDGTC